MKVGIVGAGMLGLTLAHRLSGLGHRIVLFEAGSELGGLAAAHDYGRFTWDRFYHCILPTDSHLISLLRELGLGNELRWRQTGTGYYANGRTYSMSGNADFARFPLLSMLDKARLAGTVLYATRVADPWKLYGVSAEEWLTRWCGRRGYEVFWRPLLQAKFGTYHDKVAAVFIWATLTRLFGARSAASSKEQLGYCSGGYHRILSRLESVLVDRGARVRLQSRVLGIAPSGTGCAITYRAGGDGAAEAEEQVDYCVFTAPTRLAREVVAHPFELVVGRVERNHPTSGAYLGVACLVLAVERPVIPYYVLNIGDGDVELTGVIEMTNLVDAAAETSGLSLLYLPQYMDSEDPRMRAPDDELRDAMMGRGLSRLVPDLDAEQVVYSEIHRARFVQPLPLVRHGSAQPQPMPKLETPFQVLNTSMLTCATLNNNEVVRLVDQFVERNRGALRETGRRARG